MSFSTVRSSTKFHLRFFPARWQSSARVDTNPAYVHASFNSSLASGSSWIHSSSCATDCHLSPSTSACLPILVAVRSYEASSIGCSVALGCSGICCHQRFFGSGRLDLGSDAWVEQFRSAWHLRWQRTWILVDFWICWLVAELRLLMEPSGGAPNLTRQSSLYLCCLLRFDAADSEAHSVSDSEATWWTLDRHVWHEWSYSPPSLSAQSTRLNCNWGYWLTSYSWYALCPWP